MLVNAGRVQSGGKSAEAALLSLNPSTGSYRTEPQIRRNRALAFKGEHVASFGALDHSYPGGRLCFISRKRQ